MARAAAEEPRPRRQHHTPPPAAVGSSTTRRTGCPPLPTTAPPRPLPLAFRAATNSIAISIGTLLSAVPCRMSTRGRAAPTARPSFLRHTPAHTAACNTSAMHRKVSRSADAPGRGVLPATVPAACCRPPATRNCTQPCSHATPEAPSLCSYTAPHTPEEVGGGQLPQLGLAVQGVYCLKHVAVQPPPVQVARQGVQIVGAAAVHRGRGGGGGGGERKANEGGRRHRHVLGLAAA